MNKIKYLVLFVALSVFINAYAVCPICTVVVGAGLGLSHWLKIDDTVTGIWLGGFIVSLIIWTGAWFDRKDIRFKGRKILTTLGYYSMMVLPLYPMGMIGNSFNTLWGFDKLLFGIILGSVFFGCGMFLYTWIKEKNNGHAFFPFQKVVMPVAPLVVLSVIFYFVTK